MTRADGHFRAGDADRERIVTRLRQAQAEGRLDLDEFDERLQRAWAAKTFRDLAELTADLPEPADPPEPAESRSPVASWAALVGINLAIWLAVSLTNGAFVYPWWIWVAVPWGAALLARFLTRLGS